MSGRSSARLRDARAALDGFRQKRVVRQPDLFSAIESVADHAGAPWQEHALAVVERVARERAELTVEDISPHVEPTIDMRALGAIMLTAKRRGWLVAEVCQR